MEKKYSAVVLLSGGQDSTVCAATAKRNTNNSVIALAFDYGQKHRVELQCAHDVSMLLDIPLRIVKLPMLEFISSSALLNDKLEVTDKHAARPNVPATFVPARNALFLTVAWALAMEVDAKLIYTGVCQTDYSGYSDCRADFIQSFQSSMNIGYETAVKIMTPLMDMNKCETWAEADMLGIFDVVVNNTHTCYNGVHDEFNKWEWGYGCNACPACELRKNGYEEYMFEINGDCDPVYTTADDHADHINDNEGN